MACSLSFLTVTEWWVLWACDTGKENICELKRLWFYKDYRGQGLGRLLMERLIDFATAKGYQRARFEVADAQVQAQAMKLYHKLGFYFIERYNDGPGTVFMEKVLQENVLYVTSPTSRTLGGVAFVCTVPHLNNARAITIRCTSDGPSPMRRTRASRYQGSRENSKGLIRLAGQAGTRMRCTVNDGREQSDPTLVPFPFADDDMVGVEIKVFHAEPQTSHQAYPGAIE